MNIVTALLILGIFSAVVEHCCSTDEKTPFAWGVVAAATFIAAFGGL